MGRMSRSDRQAWQSARTLADLGELTARWIVGELDGQPGYCGRSDIDSPEMVPVLAAACRAGFMTTQSQAAFDGRGFDGAHWKQRAAVEGFACGPVVERVSAAARRAGLIVIAHDPATLPRWRCRRAAAVAVTVREDRAYTAFGGQLPRRHLHDDWTGYGLCRPDALAELCGAWQVAVIDPEWGRAGVLWPVLAAAVSSPRPDTPAGIPEL